MEQYLRKTMLSRVLNSAGVYAVLMLAGMGWFLLLWGAGMPTLLAGAALGLLLCMAASRLRRHAADDRAEMIRCRLGGELALEALLLEQPAQAHRRAAELLAVRYPLTIMTADQHGALCRYGSETLLVQCIARPAACEAGSQDAAALARACALLHADRGVLCVTCRVDRRLPIYIEANPMPLRVIPRDVMLSIAGKCAPATDEQLMALKLRRERCSRASSWIRMLVHPAKARRYMGYGFCMMLMYLFTGLRVYPISGALCMGMAVLCRCARQETEGL